MSWWLIGLIVVAAIALVGLAVVSRLVSLRQSCKQAFADVETQLRGRHELAARAVAAARTAAGSAAWIENVDAARIRAASRGAGDAERSAAEAALGDALAQFAAFAETRAEIRANAEAQEALRALAEAAPKLAAAMRFYHAAATELNAALSRFPGRQAGRIIGIEPHLLFTIAGDGDA